MQSSPTSRPRPRLGALFQHGLMIVLFKLGQGLQLPRDLKMNRRKFLLSSAAFAGVVTLPQRFGFLSDAGVNPSSLHSPVDETLITILHTNDTHSQIDPLPDNDRNAGKGGVARRATLVKRGRKENPNTLLIDAGDVLQGTPYFNFYKGEVEYKAMSAIGYDVGTLGNHEFDNGVD